MWNSHHDHFWLVVHLHIHTTAYTQALTQLHTDTHIHNHAYTWALTLTQTHTHRHKSTIPKAECNDCQYKVTNFKEVNRTLSMFTLPFHQNPCGVLEQIYTALPRSDSLHAKLSLLSYQSLISITFHSLIEGTFYLDHNHRGYYQN